MLELVSPRPSAATCFARCSSPPLPPRRSVTRSGHGQSTPERRPPARRPRPLQGCLRSGRQRSPSARSPYGAVPGSLRRRAAPSSFDLRRVSHRIRCPVRDGVLRSIRRDLGIECWSCRRCVVRAAIRPSMSRRGRRDTPARRAARSGASWSAVRAAHASTPSLMRPRGPVHGAACCKTHQPNQLRRRRPRPRRRRR